MKDDSKSKNKGKETSDKRTVEDLISVPAEMELPNKLYIIPIGGRPIFPGIFTPLMISNNDDTKALEQAANESGFIGLVMLKNDVENPSLADVYDALRHKRVYKGEWTLYDTLTEIQNQRGKQFDPDLVDAFMQIKDRLEAINEAIS